MIPFGLCSSSPPRNNPQGTAALSVPVDRISLYSSKDRPLKLVSLGRGYWQGAGERREGRLAPQPLVLRSRGEVAGSATLRPRPGLARTSQEQGSSWSERPQFLGEGGPPHRPGGLCGLCVCTSDRLPGEACTTALRLRSKPRGFWRNPSGL